MSDLSTQVSAEYSKLIREQTRQVDIDSFRERGLTKVNVINAKKINELIEHAVGSVIAKLENASVQQIKEDKAQVILDSMAEFKRLFKEQSSKEEPPKETPGAEQERLRAMIREASAEQLREMKALQGAAHAKLEQEQAQREAAAAAERKRLLDSVEAMKAAAEAANARLVASVESAAAAAREAASREPPPVPIPIVQADAVKDAIMPTITSAISVSAKRAGEAASQQAAAGTKEIAESIGKLEAGITKAVESALTGVQKAVASEMSAAFAKLEQAISAAVSGQARETGGLAGKIDGLAGGLAEARAEGGAVRASLADVGGRLDALASELASSRQESSAIKAGFTALAGAVASGREEAKGIRGEVQAALARPAGVDPSGLQEAITSAVERAQRDLLAQLERQGVVRAGSAAGNADAAVASAVVRSAFRDLDSGSSEIQMDGVVRKQEVAKGDAAQHALDRLRKLRGGQ